MLRKSAQSDGFSSSSVFNVASNRMLTGWPPVQASGLLKSLTDSAGIPGLVSSVSNTVHANTMLVAWEKFSTTKPQ